MSRGLLRAALAVFALALATRWIADIVLQPHLGSYVMDLYDVLGQNILDGHGFSLWSDGSVPTVTRAPFYPLWWAADLALFGRNFLLLRMGEGFIDAVTASLVVFMTAALCRLPLSRDPLSTDAPRRWEGVEVRGMPLVPLLAGGIYAVQPYPIYYYAKMGTESWFTFWLVLLIWAFVAWLQSPSYRRGALLGAVAGMLLLNKSTAIGLLIILAFLGLAWVRGRRKAAFLSLALCFVIVGLLITPWMVRNYRVSGGHVVFIQTLTWWNFWADFEFSSSGYTLLIESRYPPGGGMPYVLSAETDVRQEAHLRAQAMEWMAANPLAMLRKMGRNLVEFWYLVEGVGRARIIAASMSVELLVAAVGGWLAWRERRWRLLLLVVTVILYFNVVYTPIKAVFHYSLVVVPFLCVLQAFLLAWAYGRITARRES